MVSNKSNFRSGIGVHKINSISGETHSVRVSANYPNIIMTPFKHARAVGVNADFRTSFNGSHLIISIKPEVKKTWISITDKENPQQTPISLMLVAVPGINSQTIVASIDQNTKKIQNAGSGVSDTVDSSNVLETVMQGNIPAGYNYTKTFSRKISINTYGISITPIGAYESSYNNVYRYRVKNSTNVVKVLSEEQFANSENIMAVSMYPSVVLKPGDTTDVFIMVEKR